MLPTKFCPPTDEAAAAALKRAHAAEAATVGLQSEVEVMRAAMAAAAERVRDSLAAKEAALTALDTKVRCSEAQPCAITMFAAHYLWPPRHEVATSLLIRPMH